MALDLERIMLLLQKRLNGMQEMKRLTCELLESASRNDQVSLELILQMRADEMARIEAARGTDMAHGRTGAGGSRAGPLADVTGVLKDR